MGMRFRFVQARRQDRPYNGRMRVVDTNDALEDAWARPESWVQWARRNRPFAVRPSAGLFRPPLPRHLHPTVQCPRGSRPISTPMEEGKPKTEFEGIAAQLAAAKAKQERDEAQGLRSSSTAAKVANKRGELHFKSSHSLLIAFFFLIGSAAPNHRSRRISDPATACSTPWESTFSLADSS